MSILGWSRDETIEGIGRDRHAAAQGEGRRRARARRAACRGRAHREPRPGSSSDSSTSASTARGPSTRPTRWPPDGPQARPWRSSSRRSGSSRATTASSAPSAASPRAWAASSRCRSRCPPTSSSSTSSATRMTAATAKVRGYDIDQPEIRSASCSPSPAPTATTCSRRPGCMAAGGKLSSVAFDRLPAPALMVLNKAVGFRLLGRIGQGTFARLGRAVPARRRTHRRGRRRLHAEPHRQAGRQGVPGRRDLRALSPPVGRPRPVRSTKITVSQRRPRGGIAPATRSLGRA